MTPTRVGDIVLVARPRLPSRIGRVARFGRSRVYVTFSDYATKKYAPSSLTLMIRTRVKTP